MADDAAAPKGAASEDSAETEAVSGRATVADGDADADEPVEAAGERDTPEDGDGDGEDGDGEGDEDGDKAQDGDKAPMSHVRLATIVGVAAVVALAALCGWLGFRGYQSSNAAHERSLYLEVGRQAALNLTTIDFEHADEDVQRVLDSSTGTFYDDFQARAQPFKEVVKQAKSKSVGSIAEAGVESVTDDGADVLVAVTVKTSNAGAAEQEPRAWRMRITVQKVGDEAKVANVRFVS